MILTDSTKTTSLSLSPHTNTSNTSTSLSENNDKVCGASATQSQQTTVSSSKQLPPSFEPCHSSLKDVECILETKELWKKFHELGTEMIITKSGR